MSEPAMPSIYQQQYSKLSFTRPVGRISSVHSSALDVTGLQTDAQIGHRVLIRRRSGGCIPGEVIQIDRNRVRILPDGPLEGIGVDDRVILMGPILIAPTNDWLGRIIDANGQPIDGTFLEHGSSNRVLLAAPPLAAQRRALGSRLKTGYAVFNTVLPIVQGQRLGLFAGSGVGKSSLLGGLASNIESDVVVIALVGERGRELRHFVEQVLGPDGLKRSVVVAATSDQSPLARRRCAWTAMAVAEHFRDQGKSVLFMIDSVTRFADAHREVAVAAGEAPVLRGYPPSTAHTIMSLCERAGPGIEGQGDITGVFSVLVAGSDMEEPIADILRGVLDGHVILDREIAERGRFPAIDILRSVSRSLPDCATDQQNKILALFRKYMSIYERNAMMINAGLYTQGNDPEIDRSIALWPGLDEFASRLDAGAIEDSFSRLEILFRREKIPIT
ncbi:MAG: FliI/YscN family ATPase [Paracoccaceae bacterium]